ncbi:MAG: zf-TFIIB domain-containing protein [Alteraurantiacibacter sp.]
MPCPVCAVPLVMSDRQGVEIDYCPQCRGVWLDRGELDKIIERSSADLAPSPPPPAPRAAPYPSTPQPHYGHEGYRPDRKGYPKRKKSFLEELFD